LARLWSELRTLLQRIGGDTSDETMLLDVVEEMITELDKADPGRWRSAIHAVGTRQTVRRYSKPSTSTSTCEHSEIRRRRLAHFLDGGSTELDEWMGIKADLDGEHGVK